MATVLNEGQNYFVNEFRKDVDNVGFRLTFEDLLNPLSSAKESETMKQAVQQ